MDYPLWLRNGTTFLIDQLNWLEQIRPDLANAILHLTRGIKQLLQWLYVC